MVDQGVIEVYRMLGRYHNLPEEFQPKECARPLISNKRGESCDSNWKAKWQTDPVIELQLEKAGVRLAYLLNAALQ